MAPMLLQLYTGPVTNLWFRLGRMFQTVRIFQLGTVAKYMKTEINQQLFRCAWGGCMCLAWWQWVAPSRGVCVCNRRGCSCEPFMRRGAPLPQPRCVELCRTPAE